MKWENSQAHVGLHVGSLRTDYINASEFGWLHLKTVPTLSVCIQRPWGSDEKDPAYDSKSRTKSKLAKKGTLATKGKLGKKGKLARKAKLARKSVRARDHGFAKKEKNSKKERDSNAAKRLNV